MKILKLNSITSAHEKLVGGKAWNLSQLIRYGFSVPRGFVITTEVFRESKEINTLIDDFQSPSKKDKINFVNQYKDLVLNWSLNQEISDQIEQLALDIESFSVRSSASIEDGANNSFAGIFDSRLNSDIDHIWDDIKAVYLSLFSEGSIDYMLSTKDRNRPEMAVIVQKMIAAKQSGVVFTSSPLAENINGSNELGINFVHDVGETLVSGAATGYHMTIDKRDNSIIASSNKAHLEISTDIFNELVTKSKMIEDRFGKPQDIEWAVDQEQLYILQTRPITTLNSPEKNLSNSLWKTILAGRDYGVQYSEVSIKSLTNLCSNYSGPEIDSQVYIPNGSNQTCLIKDNQWQLLGEWLRKKYSTDDVGLYLNDFMECAQKYEQISSELERLDYSLLSNQELVAHYHSYQAMVIEFTSYIWTSWIIITDFAQRAQFLLEHKRLSEDEIRVLLKPTELSGLPKLLEELENYSDQFNSDFLENQFLESQFEHYHWVKSLDIHSEDYLFEQFKSDVKTELRSLKEKGSQAKEKDGKNPMDGTQLNTEEHHFLAQIRELLFLKDKRDEYRKRGVYRVKRTLFTEIAARLSIDVMTISFMLQEEISESLLKGELAIGIEVIEKRRKGFTMILDDNKQMICDNDQNSEILRHVNNNMPNEDLDCIKGEVVQKGLETGIAKIVYTEKDLIKIEPGDIMVAVNTRNDYVIHMKRCKAIITDEGGLGSHAALIARENQIPCIVGCRNATKILEDGMEILVNANSGEVFFDKINKSEA